jgi:hypothetical protein
MRIFLPAMLGISEAASLAAFCTKEKSIFDMF